jgi:hypothetical protein
MKLIAGVGRYRSANQYRRDGSTLALHQLAGIDGTETRVITKGAGSSMGIDLRKETR